MGGGGSSLFTSSALLFMPLHSTHSTKVKIEKQKREKAVENWGFLALFSFQNTQKARKGQNARFKLKLETRWRRDTQNTYTLIYILLVECGKV